MFINYRESLAQDLINSPYDLQVYLELVRVDSKLGFCDIALANSYRAILLAAAAIEKTTQPYLCEAVRDCTSKRLKTKSTVIIEDELEMLQLKLYREYVNSFLGVAAFFDGMREVKKALVFFPEDHELLEMEQVLINAFKDRHFGMQRLGGTEKDLQIIARMGKIYQKAYPWLDPKLNMRTPALIKKINKGGIGAGNCEVRKCGFGPPVFGPALPPKLSKARSTANNVDIGPLGVFATRDIKKGDMVMADSSLAVVSQVPSSKMEHCDACHATLAKPYTHPSEIIKPSCCGKVAFCSVKCYRDATGYHKLLCGIDFDWLYENVGLRGPNAAGTAWRPVMFLRIIAIIIADRLKAAEEGKPVPHPLQHPLVARMASNYAPPEKTHPIHCSDWQLFENVVAPTQILMLLNINIFADPDYSPEVIQTIYWRLENNANMTFFSLHPSKPVVDNLPSTDTHRNKKRKTGENPHLSKDENESMSDSDAVQLICLNPNYLFMNHSCEPNVSWHGTVPDTSVGISWLMGVKGEINKVGSSMVFCKAFRDIREGEELKISYVGDPMGNGKNGIHSEGSDSSDEESDSEKEKVDDKEKERRRVREGKRKWLEKWFEGGCGCGICEAENVEKERKRLKAEKKGRSEESKQIENSIMKVL